MEIYERMMRMSLGPDWRRRSALEHVAQGGGRIPAAVDATTRRAVDYFRLLSRDEAAAGRAPEKYPDLHSAHAAWNHPELRAAVQKLVLADVPASEICELTQLQPAVLAWVESLWFDVRPVLSATHWIVAMVIKAEADAGRDDVAAEMRLAYFYGPHAAKTLIAAKLRLPIDPSIQASDAALLLHAKFIQAIEMPLNPDHQREFLKLHAEIQHDQELLKLAREKLSFQMRRWTERLELVKNRGQRSCHGQDTQHDPGHVRSPVPEGSATTVPATPG